MKRLFILLTLLFIVSARQPILAQKSEQDDKIDRLCDALLRKESREDNTNTISLIVAFAGTVIGGFGIALTFHSVKKERSNRQIDFLSEVDKLLMQDPYLWAIYDIHQEKFKISVSSQMTQDELDGKLDAFCYFHLNNFELVFLYPSQVKASRKTWTDFMVHLMVSSTKFKEIATKESTGYIYNEDYQKIIIKLLRVADQIIPSYLQYRTDESKRQEYHTAAKRILNEYHLTDTW